MVFKKLMFFARNSLPILLLIYAVICSIFNFSIGLFLFPVIIVTIILVSVFTKKTNYPLTIYCISLALILQITLLSRFLNGSDVVLEYWVHAKVLQDGFWNTAIPNIYFASLGISILSPIYSLILGIDGAFIFKIIFPIIYAIAPVVLFYIYKKFLNSQYSFIAVMIYVLCPVYFLEMPIVVRQQSAILVLVLSLYFLLLAKTICEKISAVLFLLVIALLYYGLGLIVILSMVAIFGLIVVNKIVKIKFRGYSWVSTKLLIVITIIITLITGVYYSVVADGVATKSAIIMVRNQIFQFIYGISGKYIFPWTTNGAQWSNSTGNITTEGSSIWSIIMNTANRTPMITAGLGLDFISTSIEGKIYRVLTIALNFLIIVGIAYILFHRKRIPKVFIAIIAAALLASVAYLLLPVISSYMGVTRLYHLVLIVFAPVIVLAGRFLFGHKKYVLCIILPLYIFSSGMVFEIFNYQVTDRMDIPFSSAISGSRLDMGVNFTNNDIMGIKVISDIIYNQQGKVYVDLYSKMLASQYIVWENEFDWNYKCPIIDGNMSEGYIFLREENISRNELIIPAEYGLRKAIKIDNSLLEGREIIYNNGARIYSPRKSGLPKS